MEQAYKNSPLINQGTRPRPSSWRVLSCPFLLTDSENERPQQQQLLGGGGEARSRGRDFARPEWCTLTFSFTINQEAGGQAQGGTGTLQHKSKSRHSVNSARLHHVSYPHRRHRFLNAASAFSFKLHPRLLPVFFASSLSHPSIPTFSLFFFLNSERGGGGGGTGASSGSAFPATPGSGGGGGGIDSRRRRRPELIQRRADRLPFL